MTVRSVPALLLAAALAPSAAAQQRPPTFEAHVDVVNLSLTVDAKLSAPLAASDVTVYDNGRPQAISYFSERPLPLDIVLLMDVSTSMRGYAKEMRESARRLIDALGPDDRMQLMAFADRTMLSQPFTADKRALVERLDWFPPSDRTVLWQSLYVVLHDLERTPADPEHPRRRVLLAITDGIDTGSLVAPATLRETARRSIAAVYVLVIAPAGVPGDSQDLAQSRYELRRTCEESGGLMAEAATPFALTAFVRRIAAGLATEYTVAWSPDAPHLHEPWHQVQVAVRGVPSDGLRYRNGYLHTLP